MSQCLQIKCRYRETPNLLIFVMNCWHCMLWKHVKPDFKHVIWDRLQKRDCSLMIKSRVQIQCL